MMNKCFWNGFFSKLASEDIIKKWKDDSQVVKNQKRDGLKRGDPLLASRSYPTTVIETNP